MCRLFVALLAIVSVGCSLCYSLPKDDYDTALRRRDRRYFVLPLEAIGDTQNMASEGIVRESRRQPVRLGKRISSAPTNRLIEAEIDYAWPLWRTMEKRAYSEPQLTLVGTELAKRGRTPIRLG
uniref:Uncharacterized protein n=1 Tax=Plectus sambesii TaxID=2011161 RepID=A0A914W0I1_9BILA